MLHGISIFDDVSAHLCDSFSLYQDLKKKEEKKKERKKERKKEKWTLHKKLHTCRKWNQNDRKDLKKCVCVVAFLCLISIENI